MMWEHFTAELLHLLSSLWFLKLPSSTAEDIGLPTSSPPPTEPRPSPWPWKMSKPAACKPLRRWEKLHDEGQWTAKLLHAKELCFFRDMKSLCFFTNTKNNCWVTMFSCFYFLYSDVLSGVQLVWLLPLVNHALNGKCPLSWLHFLSSLSLLKAYLRSIQSIHKVCCASTVLSENTIKVFTEREKAEAEIEKCIIEENEV